MKTRFILFLSALLSITNLLAQSPSKQKIGYVDPQYVISQLPEFEKAKSELQTYQEQLKGMLEQKVKQYEEKVTEFQKNSNTYIDLVKQEKEKELVALQENIREFEKTANESMSKKESALMDSLVGRVRIAIREVSKEQKYTYILNSTGGENGIYLLYAENKQDDISDLVLKKLGVIPVEKSVTKNIQ